MLAGRNDVDSVAYYAKQMREYSDDGKTLNGAYGYRWRKAKTNVLGSGVDDGIVYDEIDQLAVIVNHLKAQTESRRAVLQMWNVEDDLLKIGSDLDFMRGKESKDVCCNLSVMFAVRKVNTGPGDYGDEYRSYLDMTVTNRSNDLIWGLLGANFVHFTILQEYMAARLGVAKYIVK
jgi:thymidylate synthase